MKLVRAAVRVCVGISTILAAYVAAWVVVLAVFSLGLYASSWAAQGRLQDSTLPVRLAIGLMYHTAILVVLWRPLLRLSKAAERGFDRVSDLVQRVSGGRQVVMTAGH